MLSKLGIPDAWMWSAWQPDRGMNFNSYVFRGDGGCIAVDPLPLDDATMDELQNRGGVRTIVLTNRDHERGAQALKDRFASRIVAHEPEAALFKIAIDATFRDRDEVFPGAFAVALPHGKTGGEIALHLPAHGAAVVGDALIGAPAGALSLLPDEKLEDRRAFLFALRRLWSLQLSTLLLCDGQPIFGNADAAIGKLLEERGGAEINRINAGELYYEPYEGPEKYRWDDGEAGLLIGARKLGYRVAKMPPNSVFCPLHWHAQCEEFFYVIEGRPSIRTSRGTVECRTGDFIAFPVGERGAHQLRNDSDEPCTVMLVGIEDAAVGLEACVYPDSDKIGVWGPDERLCLTRRSPELDYYDGEISAGP